MNPQSSRMLVVAGTVTYDYLIYPMTTSNRIERADLNDGDDVSQLVIRAGAADLVARILSDAAPRRGFDVLGPKLQHPATSCLRNNASSVVDLEVRDSISPGVPSYRVVRNRLIDKAHVWHSPPIEEASAAKAATVIISGSGEAFRDVEPALDFLERVKPRYIVHHMTRPLATGALWDLIRDGPRTRDGIPDPDYLAVIVDADDLRAEGISLSRSLSWEATTEDFVRNLGSNGRLDTLVTCPNLIVRFGNEGVIYHRGRDATDPKLYFNSWQTERDGHLAGGKGMVGLASAFTAGFALGFADSSPPNGDKGVRMGISAARDMERNGFVTNPIDEAPDYPIDTIAQDLRLERITAVSIPSSRISSGDSWSILNTVTGDPTEVARQVVTFGPEFALGRCPTQKFGELISIERREQESLRAVLDAVQEHVISDSSQPTSIGIIGPSGSGKKFVASNLVKHFTAERDVVQLTYNARLLRREDLIALCHKIRDHTASGTFTVVCFENFEAILEPGSEIRNDFLVIMRDGLFTDRSHVRNLGRPLLFFLVNQRLAVDDDDSLSPIDHTVHRGPNGESLLLDYLHGLVRIKGPNQAGSDDDMYSVRRAMMLRHMLKQRFPHLEVNGTIKVDEAVLHALLLVPEYKHGLRSLDKILSTSRLSSRSKFDISALPPEEQIQLHVDGRAFMSYLRSPKLPGALREKLAQGLFTAYKIQREKMARTESQKKELENDQAMCDWAQLSSELKESTRAQADDIPRKLRAVRCFMLNDENRTEPLIHVPEFSTEDLDMLSEMEHERFNAERLQKQWRMGPRSSAKRSTPFIVPYRDLTQDWKDVDRVMVECVPRVLATAGWKIYRMQEEF